MEHGTLLERGFWWTSRQIADGRPRVSIAGYAVIAALVLVLVGAPRGAWAQASSHLGTTMAAEAAVPVYEVRGIDVDTTADSATAAREQAIAKGQVVALQQLLKRLTLSSEHSYLPVPDVAQAAALVRDFEVTNEKASTVRYIAKLNYRFKADGVRNLLTARGIPFAETRSRSVLVLPVYGGATSPVLWDETNPWLAVWQRLPPRDGLVPLVTPIGDLADISVISADSALAGNATALSRVASNYGASDVLVVEVTPDPEGYAGAAVFKFTATRYGSRSSPSVVSDVFVGNPGEPQAETLRRLATLVINQVEDNWKRRTLIRGNTSTVLPVKVPVSGINQWIEAETRLKTAPGVSQVEVILVTHREVWINLHFRGTPRQVGRALEQINLQLSDEAGVWVLRPLSNFLGNSDVRTVEPLPLPAYPASNPTGTTEP